MRKPFSSLVAAAGFLCLSACASAETPTEYWRISDKSFSALKRDVSTKEDVRRQIGVPQTEMHFPRQNVDVWEYRYLEGTTIRMIAEVYFDAEGRFTHSAHMLDPAYTGGMM